LKLLKELRLIVVRGFKSWLLWILKIILDSKLYPLFQEKVT